MNKFLLVALSVVTLFITTSAFAYDTAPDVSSSTNNLLGPSLNWNHVLPLTDNLATAYGVELGLRNDRVSGTIGYAFGDSYNQRIKLTGEYLWQDIDYTFYSGVTRQWVNQGAVGLDYQYLLNRGIFSDLDLAGYYSHAPSKNLSAVNGAYTNPDGGLFQYTNLRRIAGSNAQGLSTGTDIKLWPGANANVKLDYDRVIYDTEYQPNRNAIGLGAETTLSQKIASNVKTDLTASVRQPFNYYKADLVWTKNFAKSALDVGLYGSYTHGKNTLPNTAQTGVTLAYKALGNIATQSRNNILNDDANSLTSWTLQPAVRMPQVLAVADQKVIQTNTCVAFIGPNIGNQVVGAGEPITAINSATVFSGGSSVTYALIGTPPPGVSINSATGVISGTTDPFSNETFTLQVRATSSCGSALSNQFSIQVNA